MKFAHRLILITYFLFAFNLMLMPARSCAQAVSRGALLKLTAAADAFGNDHPIQTIYIQFDKPYYAIGDTIWFKAWVFNAAYFTPAYKTGICYIELANQDNKVVNRMMLPVAQGVTSGSIALDEKDITEGNYTVRAYTSLMCNFGDDYIFKKSFYFFNAPLDDLLVNTKTSFLKDNGMGKAHVNLQFNHLNKEAAVLKQMHLNVTDSHKILYKKEVQTNVDGSLDLDLLLKKPPRQLALEFSDVSGNTNAQKLDVPISFNRPEDIDLQFMPEGGNLVDGLPAYIGFKAVGEDGKSVVIEGNVFNNKQILVASFKSTHKGMGVFYMVPHAGENYLAKVSLSGGLTKTYTLPAVAASGTVLKVRTVAGTDSLAITVTGTKEGQNYFLTGQARGITCYAAVINLENNAAKIKIPCDAFPTGVAHFTLMNAERQPLNERLVFIDHLDYLRVNVNANKSSYAPHDSVALSVHITDKNGHPVKGNFCVAVTDDAQIKTDSVKSNSMITYLFLTKELKGIVEDPGYYFQTDLDGSIKQHLDNLLLTQGWVGYDWKEIFGPAKPSLYTNEEDFVVKGYVSNVFNKPVVNSRIILLSKKPSFIMDTITDKNGRFVFKHIIPVDTPVYFLEARNKNGRSFNIDLKVDEFKPPFFALDVELPVPWYINTNTGDSSLINFVTSNIRHKLAVDKKLFGGGHVLKEVVIKAKKIVRGSQNLNGAGSADIIIDERELEKAGKKSLLDLLIERIPGFTEKVYNITGDQPEPDNQQLPTFITDGHGSPGNWYYVSGKPVKLVVDGIPIGKILSIGTFRELNEFLRSHSAEDIKGVELMSSAKYASNYVPAEYAMVVSPSDYSFIEFTTRSGHGPALNFTPGVYLYKPLPFTFPRQFYSPEYTSKLIELNTMEYRPTLYWKPDMVTNYLGDATITFYCSGKKSTYTIIIEGTDGNGNIGSGRSAININAE